MRINILSSEPLDGVCYYCGVTPQISSVKRSGALVPFGQDDDDEHTNGCTAAAPADGVTSWLLFSFTGSVSPLEVPSGPCRFEWAFEWTFPRPSSDSTTPQTSIYTHNFSHDSSSRPVCWGLSWQQDYQRAGGLDRYG